MNEAHAVPLDRIYGVQRHIYDVTRKYYLFGRDTALRNLNPGDNDRVLEIGTGTARNLITLARRNPHAYYFGIDASEEMLKTASANVHRRGLSARIRLGFGFAEQEEDLRQFYPGEGYDRILFSYSLSMIPQQEAALDSALGVLNPGGSIWIVDFWDFHSYPVIFQRMLNSWLHLFHVYPDPKFRETCTAFSRRTDTSIACTPIGGSYALLIQIQKR